MVKPVQIDTVETPIDALLRRQRSLSNLATPVAEFAEASAQSGVSDLEPHYSRLIPLTSPGKGEQYAFEVDLDRCTGCKACVSACHSLNGLDEEETWREVGLIQGGSPQTPYLQTITTACHHCEDPACANGCPVLAYEKDPVTGIVLHLDDQCIGCQYCILKCPYDVPKYSSSRGIVRKCDMCHGRLASGEAPACVQACPTEAIRITIVDTPERPKPEESLVPGAFPSDYTRPTTRYRSRKPIPENAQPADTPILRPQHAHWPLIYLLVLTQFSVGALLADAILGPGSTAWEMPLVLAFLAGHLGLIASVAHLGKPLKAWRVFLGLRRSWLSREAVVFGAYGAAISLGLLLRFLPVGDRLESFISWASVGFGLLGVFTSIMIYHDTRRPFWHLRFTALRFFGTVATGFLAVLALCGYPAVGLLLTIWIAGKTLVGESFVRSQRKNAASPFHKTARIIGELERKALTTRRLALAALALASFLLLAGTPSGLLALPFLFTALLPEFAERYLFFRAVDAPRMPGHVSP